MRRMRRVSLVLVDERRGRVDVCADHTTLERCAAHHHETLRFRQVVIRPRDAVCAEHQRVIRRQRNIDVAILALGHQVQSVIEELAEERHPLVEASAQA
ncbi:hypothetical protein D3C84_129080 [compost metagenome]